MKNEFSKPNQQYKRGQIFWVDFGNGGKGSEQNGCRPAIIVQNDIGNKYSPTVIVAVLSSQIQKAKLPTHVILKKSEFNWLNKDSFIAFEQLKTIDKSRIGAYIGEILEDRYDEAIEVSLGLKKYNNSNDYYKIAEGKVKEVNELSIVIDYWINKDKNINLIRDVIDEYTNKMKELLSFTNKYNIANERLCINFIKVDGMVEV